MQWDGMKSQCCLSKARAKIIFSPNFFPFEWKCVATNRQNETEMLDGTLSQTFYNLEQSVEHGDTIFLVNCKTGLNGSGVVLIDVRFTG